MISLNQSERDRLIETILESINIRYENLERGDKELKKIKQERNDIILQNDINLW